MIGEPIAIRVPGLYKGLARFRCLTWLWPYWALLNCLSLSLRQTGMNSQLPVIPCCHNTQYNLSPQAHCLTITISTLDKIPETFAGQVSLVMVAYRTHKKHTVPALDLAHQPMCQAQVYDLQAYCPRTTRHAFTRCVSNALDLGAAPAATCRGNHRAASNAVKSLCVCFTVMGCSCTSWPLIFTARCTAAPAAGPWNTT